MNYYDLSKDPIDEVDALAKDHDMAYATLAEGYEGWFNDERTAVADIDFVVGLKMYLQKVETGDYKDKYTGGAPSQEAIRGARNASTLFTAVAAKKYGERGVRFVQKKIDREKRKIEKWTNSLRNEMNKLKRLNFNASQ